MRKLHKEILAKLWSYYNARPGVWTYSGSKGFLEDIIGSGDLESTMWQLYMVWIKKKKSRDTGGKVISITHESRGNGEELLKGDLLSASGKASLLMMKLEYPINTLENNRLCNAGLMRNKNLACCQLG